jgi:hypothetical protein
MNRSSEPRIGIGWYTPESYRELLAIADDRDALPDTFEEWEKQARKTLFIMRGEGHEPEQVFLNISELRAWCLERKLPINGNTRADFVSKKLHQAGPIGKLKL